MYDWSAIKNLHDHNSGHGAVLLRTSVYWLPYVWECSGHLMAWRPKIAVFILSYILRWKEIGQLPLLHLCSLLPPKTFLKIKTLGKASWGGYYWHCWAFDSCLNFLLDKLSAICGRAVILTRNSNPPHPKYHVLEAVPLWRGVKTKSSVRLTIDGVLESRKYGIHTPSTFHRMDTTQRQPIGI
jgi:hypothetical protein